MALIDPEGRVFGIVNVVDLVLAGVLLMLAIGGWRYLHPAQAIDTALTVNEGEVLVTVLLEQPEIANMVRVGDQALHNGEATIKAVRQNPQRCYPDTILEIAILAEENIPRMGERLTLSFANATVKGTVIPQQG